MLKYSSQKNNLAGEGAVVLDFVTWSYMVDNVILLITGKLHWCSIPDLVFKCHPLGSLEKTKVMNITQTPTELYRAILIDTPLVSFFFFNQDCISKQDLDELNIEIIQNMLYKAYLESFYKFCTLLGRTGVNDRCPVLRVWSRLLHLYYHHSTVQEGLCPPLSTLWMTLPWGLGSAGLGWFP